MLGAFSDFLDFTLGQPTLGPDCKRKRADAAIAAFTHLLAEISPPPEEGVDHFGTQAQRDARADRVDAAARAYALGRPASPNRRGRRRTSTLSPATSGSRYVSLARCSPGAARGWSTSTS